MISDDRQRFRRGAREFARFLRFFTKKKTQVRSRPQGPFSGDAKNINAASFERRFDSTQRFSRVGTLRHPLFNFVC